MAFFRGGDGVTAKDSVKMVVLVILNKTQEFKGLGVFALAQALTPSSLATLNSQCPTLPWGINR